VDGLVVVTPYFFKFSQADLVDYYRALAAESSKPLFVYYLPALTGVTMSLDIAVQIAGLPNIAGIKSSADFAWTSSLMERVPTEFRVIAAAPNIFSKLLRAGVPEQLDGIFAVVPAHTEKIVEAAKAEDWDRADQLQSQLNAMLGVMVQKYEIFPATTTLLNAQGIPGNCAIRPMRELTPDRARALLEEPTVQQCLCLSPAPSRAVYLGTPVSSNGSH
jgi:4-hydroxy-tetrahydrodipicolinate synthase